MRSFFENKVVRLVLVLLVTTGLTALGLLLRRVPGTTFRILCNCLVYAVLLLPALADWRRSGHRVRELFANRSAAQWGYALLILAVFSGLVAWLPALVWKVSMVGEAVPFDGGLLALEALFYIGFVGPVEEFIFRVYAQERLEELLGRGRAAAPLLAGLAFALFHVASGSLGQFAFTLVFGTALGYLKFFRKNCTGLSCALGHGMYDFCNVVVRMLVL